MFESAPGQGITMDERRRQTYLAALGVDLYVAREPLPHAAPSWFFEWEAEWEREARWEDDPTVLVEEVGPTDVFVPAETASTLRSPADKAAVAAAVNAVAQSKHVSAAAAEPRAIPVLDPSTLTIPELRNLKPAPVAADSVRAPQVNSSLRIGLSVFEWPGRLRVLIEMSDADAPSLSAREHRLWHEIALALWGRDLAYSAQTLPVFRFPPSAKLTHLETPEAVREAVESFLQARHARSPVGLQLVFAGRALAAAYLGQRGAVVQDACLVDVPGVTQSLLLPSMEQLLNDWQLKAPVWRAMAAACRQVGISA